MKNGLALFTQNNQLVNNGQNLMKLAGDYLSKLLSAPGDHLEAVVTKASRQVVKIRTREIRSTLTRYPSTGTIVETRVFREE